MASVFSPARSGGSPKPAGARLHSQRAKGDTPSPAPALRPRAQPNWTQRLAETRAPLLLTNLEQSLLLPGLRHNPSTPTLSHVRTAHQRPLAPCSHRTAPALNTHTLAPPPPASSSAMPPTDLTTQARGQVKRLLLTRRNVLKAPAEPRL